MSEHFIEPWHPQEDLNSLTEEVRGLKDVLKQMALGQRDSVDGQSVQDHPLYLQVGHHHDQQGCPIGLNIRYKIKNFLLFADK